MPKLTVNFLLPGLFLLLASIACNFPGTNPTISDAWMALDYYGEQPTSVYSPLDVFYCVATLSSSSRESIVQAEWSAVEVEGLSPDQAIGQAELSARSGSLHFELSNPGPWPTGKYKVNIYLNGSLVRALEFAVR